MSTKNPCANAEEAITLDTNATAKIFAAIFIMVAPEELLKLKPIQNWDDFSLRSKKKQYAKRNSLKKRQILLAVLACTQASACPEWLAHLRRPWGRVLQQQ